MDFDPEFLDPELELDETKKKVLGDDDLDLGDDDDLGDEFADDEDEADEEAGDAGVDDIY